MKVKFEFRGNNNDNIKNVHLAGSFNRWEAGKTPLSYDKQSRSWKKSLDLERGNYPYKYIINNEEWIHDPDGERFIQNDIGSLDSIKLVKPKNKFHGRFHPVHPTINDKITIYSTRKAELVWNINESLNLGGKFKNIHNREKMEKVGKRSLYKSTIGPFSSNHLPEVIVYGFLYNKNKFDNHRGKDYWIPLDLKLRGKTMDLKIKSNALQDESYLRVYIPEGYDDESNKEYPLLILLHGYGGTYKSDWTQQNIIKKMADLQGLILVWPDGNVRIEKEMIPCWYINSPKEDNAQMEDYIIKETIPYMERKFKVKKERKAHSIAGISMGGFGSFYLATKYNEYFSSAASLSAIHNIHPAKKIYALKKLVGWGNWSKKCYNTLKLIKKSKGCAYYFIIGNKEMGAYGDNYKLKKIMEDKNIPHKFRVYPGDHTNNFWRKYIQEMMEYLVENKG